MPRSAIPDTDWNTPAPPKVPGTPKREHCGAYVSGTSMASYPCLLGIGHADVPKDDPEPHYAYESARSVREWQAWAEREWERRRGSNPQAQEAEQYGTEDGGYIETPEVDESIVCPAGLRGCDLTFPHSHGTDTGFDKVHERQGRSEPLFGRAPVPDREPVVDLPSPGTTDTAFDEEAHTEDAQPLMLMGTMPIWAVHQRTSITDRWERSTDWMPKDDAESLAQSARTGNDRVKAESPGRAPHIEYMVLIKPPEPNPKREALRTRPEDQRLPDGDESLDDDQSLLIADIEERRKVGVQRYGQGHRPFNGRDTLQDAYEEMLDHLVYLRSIVRMAAATRDDLIEAVTVAISKERPLEIDKAAEIAVDRIMGWVAAKTIDKDATRETLIQQIRQIIGQDRINHQVALLEERPFNPEAVVDKIVNQILAP